MDIEKLKRDSKRPNFVKEDPIVVSRRIIAGIAKESLEKGLGQFSEAFDVDELTDKDVQDFLDFHSGKLDIVDFEDRTENFVGALKPNQKELWDYIGSVLRKDLDRR